MADILRDSPASDWRKPDPKNLLVMELAAGKVVIELAPRFAPEHVANIKKLAQQGYYNGLSILRSQDNYVVQWGDPNASDEAKRKTLGKAKSRLEPEFTILADSVDNFQPLPDGDVYAPEVGFVDGFPVARDTDANQMWLAHCYAMVGVGRDNEPDSGNGAELYVVTGHSPRHLDKNVVLVGRVLVGMPLLSSLPRGSGELGFYTEGEGKPALEKLMIASDLPQSEQPQLEQFDTQSANFQNIIKARRFRRESWFLDSVGKVELCNVPLPVR